MLNKMKCQLTCVQYNKLKSSGGNDPSITQSMRYSQLVNNKQYTSNTNKLFTTYSVPIFTNRFSKK